VTQPNVIFVLADQHRWDFLGTEGNGVTYTPNLDRLARAGVGFASTYCTAPLCCPSRAAIISGRYAMNTAQCYGTCHQPQSGERISHSHAISPSSHMPSPLGKCRFSSETRYLTSFSPDWPRLCSYERSPYRQEVPTPVDLGTSSSRRMPTYPPSTVIGPQTRLTDCGS